MPTPATGSPPPSLSPPPRVVALLPLHNEQTHGTKKVWRSRVSIPVPPACKAGALPFELHPRGRLSIRLHETRSAARRAKRKLRQPGVEPGAKAWEASMLPIHHWRLPGKGHKSRLGGAGFRSLCLPIANRPLYRVSYTPVTDGYGALLRLSHKKLNTSYGVRTHASCETGA